jgi:hypothetical protein
MLHTIVVIFVIFQYVSCSYFCGEDKEGSWLIGFVNGENPFTMTLPKDKYVDKNGESKICPRNPIIACTDVHDIQSTFVADPWLFFPDGESGDWYAFMEVKKVGARGKIGAAVSTDKVRIDYISLLDI